MILLILAVERVHGTKSCLFENICRVGGCFWGGRIMNVIPGLSGRVKGMRRNKIIKQCDLVSCFDFPLCCQLVTCIHQISYGDN